MWSIKGIPHNIKAPIIARYSTSSSSWANLMGEKTIKYLTDSDSSHGVFLGLSDAPTTGRTIPMIIGLQKERIEEIRHDDILQILPTGEVRKIWNSASKNNVLYLTDRCNSRCVMCPQIPGTTGDYSDDVLTLLKLLKQDEVNLLCVTGGEPTILREKIIDILGVCQKKFSSTPLLLLTNGRGLNDFSFAQAMIKKAPTDTLFAIPIYSPVASVHDAIVGVPGAFQETIRGVHNLIRLNAKVEIRIVVTAMNYKLLSELANFIGWNLPMVYHVAIMGMEVHGVAAMQVEKVWIEPTEYADALQDAVRKIAYRNIPVSIYNLPLCIVPEGVRRFCRKSISDWKQKYLPECEKCCNKNNCAGFFTTSSVIPKGIAAL